MRTLSHGEWFTLRQQAEAHIDLSKNLAKGVLRQRPHRTRLFAHLWHEDEYAFWQQAAAARGDGTILIVGCDSALNESAWRKDLPRAYEFEAEDSYDLYRDELLFRLFDNWGFYDWFDTFAVWSPSGGWLSYLNNRCDIGLISAFSQDAVVAIGALSSEIFLSLEDLQDRKSWYYLDIDPAVLESNYNFVPG